MTAGEGGGKASFPGFLLSGEKKATTLYFFVPCKSNRWLCFFGPGSRQDEGMLVGCIKAMNGWRRCRAMWCSRKFDGRRTGVAAAFGSRRDGNDGAKVTQGAVFAVGKVRETLARSLKSALPKNLTNCFILISINP